MNDLRRIIVVGAGECGMRAALTLRDQGFDGEIDLINGEAVDPYERPPLSKYHPDGNSLKPIMGVDRLSSLGITRYDAVQCVGIDRHNKSIELSSGKRLSYDRLLLAIGSRPRALVVDGKPVPKALLLRTSLDAERLHEQLLAHRHLVVIGGGFIGLEVAALARQKNVSVTLVEVAPRLLGRAVPSELAERIEARHRQEGVTFHIGHKIKSISKEGRVTLENGTEICGDVLLAGIGSEPHVEVAKDAGLSVENGILVDDKFQTSDPSIYAAGDCCAFPHPLYGMKRMRLESWRAAQEQGEHAARAILGSQLSYEAVPWFWSDQYYLTLQIAGLPSEGATVISRLIDEDAEILFHCDAEGRLVAASGICRGNRIARDIRLAEMLIAKRVCPDPALLRDPTINLKTLLSSASASASA